MGAARIGFVTIGQSPRDDIVPDMLALLPFDAAPVERGAIDDLTLDEVRELAPRGDEHWMVSRMRDGTEVRLAQRELAPRMQARIDELTALGVDLIVPLCASNWSMLRSETAFINPGAALGSIVRAMCRPGGTLGVISPTEDQARLSVARYGTPETPVLPASAQPYADEATRRRQCASAGRLMARPDVGLVYMGCMGHTREMRSVVREVSGKPTVTANGITASLIAQALA